MGEKRNIFIWGEHSQRDANAWDHPSITSQTPPSNNAGSRCQQSLEKETLKLFIYPKIQSRAVSNFFCKFCQHTIDWKRVDTCKDHMVSPCPCEKQGKHYVAHTLSNSKMKNVSFFQNGILESKTEFGKKKLNRSKWADLKVLFCPSVPIQSCHHIKTIS